MNIADKQYQDLLQEILDNGVEKTDRTGTGTKSIFGTSMKFNLRDGFPLLTTKKMFTKGVIHELLWFINGDVNIKYLVDNNVHIWDDDAYRFFNKLINKHNEYAKFYEEFDNESGQIVFKLEDHDSSNLTTDLKECHLTKEEFIEKVKNGSTMEIAHSYSHYASTYQINFSTYTFGDLGPVYGKQWRSFGVENVDQIQNIIDTLKTNPDDRRMLCIAYNPDVLEIEALPPCHLLCQFYTRPLEIHERVSLLGVKKDVSHIHDLKDAEIECDHANIPKRELSCLWYQRSVDTPLGLPFNIASYALLTNMIAHVCNMTVGDLIFNGGDTHIYLNQIDGVKEQLKRDPDKYNSPKLCLNPYVENIDNFTFNDIKIIGYESYDTIKMPLSTGV